MAFGLGGMKTDRRCQRAISRTANLNGLSTFWSYENGQKSSEIHYKDGMLDGLWTGWHENGQKDEEGQWKNGEQNGLWTYWHENGKKKSGVQYKDGKEVSRKEF